MPRVGTDKCPANRGIVCLTASFGEGWRREDRWSERERERERELRRESERERELREEGDLIENGVLRVVDYLDV